MKRLSAIVAAFAGVIIVLGIIGAHLPPPAQTPAAARQPTSAPIGPIGITASAQALSGDACEVTFSIANRTGATLDGFIASYQVREPYRSPALATLAVAGPIGDGQTVSVPSFAPIACSMTTHITITRVRLCRVGGSLEPNCGAHLVFASFDPAGTFARVDYSPL